MSAEILQRAREAGAIDAHELADLFNVTPSAGYDYFGRTKLSFNQFRTLFRRAKHDLVRELFLSNLLRGLGWIAIKLDPARDLNGDGRVDTADALKAGIDQLARSAETLRRLNLATADGHIDPVEAQDICLELDHVISEAVTTRNLVHQLQQLTPRRRKAIQRPVGLDA